MGREHAAASEADDPPPPEAIDQYEYEDFEITDYEPHIPHIKAECGGLSITLIVARADNGVIGRDGAACPGGCRPISGALKALTMGAPMIMGRKTFESLPGLLPGRRHIVLTRDRGWQAEGAETAHTVDEALAVAGGGAVSVIGGAKIFGLFEPLADRIELTEVHGDIAGDTVMAPFDSSRWREATREHHPAVGQRPAYSFVRLVRR